jgi:uncharacterized protein (TIGR02118 family)
MPAMRNGKKNGSDVQLLLLGEWLSIFLSKSYGSPQPPLGNMLKLVALFKKPEETEDFDRMFAESVLPLLRQIPGLERLELTRVTGAPFGESKIHLMVELYFRSRQSLDAAMASKEGKGVAKGLLKFSSEVSSLFHGEVQEIHEKDQS